MRIRVNKDQRDASNILALRLTEMGYLIFPVAPWYRRHHLDRIAISKSQQQFFFVFRPMRNGTITVRPYSYHGNAPIRDMVKSLGMEQTIRCWNRALPKLKDGETWSTYLSKSDVVTYSRIMGMSPSVRKAA
ncbi:MAG: hypothetical protein JWO50_687 [Candidatus Kaiserbacteria bacterium]|nr:hypothetical protein [Candidatus Kaiserbacteria bacterium]